MILVTGTTGFIGPRVVHALRARDLPVRALVRQADRATQLERWGCELAQGDLGDRPSLERAVDRCSVVVHLVSIITGSPADFDRVMSQGTADLTTAAQEAGVGRFVLMSALGTSEQTRELVPYYRAKWAMEQAVKGADLGWVIFRPGFVFGAAGGVLPTFLRQVRYSPITPVVGTGERRLQPIWVDDVAAFFAKAVDAPSVTNRTFELGGPDVLTWNELYAALAAALGKRRPSVHLPVGLVRAAAALVERLPQPPITRDQLTMLEVGDNVCDPTEANETFDLEPIGLAEMLRRSTG